MHRLAHTIPWLWRIHAIHDSAEELDWLIAFGFIHRLALMRVATLAPVVALNISPAAVAFFVAVGVWQAWLVHANVRISLRSFERAFVSPHFHHWHQTADREAFDKNFAGIIAAWDFIFNTAHLPRAQHPQRYGTTESVPAGYLERLIDPTGLYTPAEELLAAAELRRL